MKSVRVQIDKPIFVPADRAGSESPAVQVFPVWLSVDSSELRKHFVVCAYLPELNQTQRESVEARLGGGAAAFDFMVEDTEGMARVVADISEGDSSAFDVAAAVAVVKASCGWDESNPIMVRVNGIEVAVAAQFDGIVWVATSPM